MASRFYLPSSGAATVNPAFDATWELTSDADRLRMATAKQNTSYQTRQLVAYSPALSDTLWRQYVSDPLNAGSISGTVKGILQAKAQWGTWFPMKTQIVIRVVSNNGLIVRGTLLSSGTGHGSDYSMSTRNGYAPPSATAIATIVAQQSDRIVIEIGVRVISLGIFSSYAQQKYGDPTSGADLAENETDTAEGVPWIEFSQTLSFETGGAPPPAVAAPTVGGAFTTPRELVQWRLMLCDLNGVAIANLTRIARDKQLTYTLNRASSCSFHVPSDHALVNTLHTDGYPLLEAKMRTIKAYRYEGGSFDDGTFGYGSAYGADAYGAGSYAGGALSTGSYVLRFAGTVDVIEDTARGDEPRTTVTCFDPLKHLERRLCRDSGGGTSEVAFDGDQSGQIVRILIDRANVLGATGVATDGSLATTTGRVMSFTHKSIAAVITELADSDFDLYLAPVERFDGILCTLHVYVSFGNDRPDVIFGWDSSPGSATGVTRVRDGTELANVVVSAGGSGLNLEKVDATSIGLYRRHEVVSNYADTTDMGFLNAMGDSEIGVRKHLRERITMELAQGRAAEPFSHFYLGDTVRTRASSRLRGGFTRSDRIYAFTVTVDDDGSERLSSVTLAAS